MLPVDYGASTAAFFFGDLIRRASLTDSNLSVRTSELEVN